MPSESSFSSSIGAAESLEQYKVAQIETATPERLIVMLYEGAIKFLQLAVQALEHRHWETSNRNILRAEAILLELMNVLDMNLGGELAQNLYNLYDYMYRTLVRANLEHQPEAVREVIGLLENLCSAWEQAANIVGQMRSEGKLDNEPQGRYFAG